MKKNKFLNLFIIASIIAMANLYPMEHIYKLYDSAKRTFTKHPILMTSIGTALTAYGLYVGSQIYNFNIGPIYYNSNEPTQAITNQIPDERVFGFLEETFNDDSTIPDNTNDAIIEPIESENESDIDAHGEIMDLINLASILTRENEITKKEAKIYLLNFMRMINIDKKKLSNNQFIDLLDIFLDLNDNSVLIHYGTNYLFDHIKQIVEV